jgi:hypothetical protein
VHFVEWSRTAFRLFGSRISLWCTFNEPTCTTFCGFIVGLHPPGELLSLVTAGHVICNMLRAHTAAYFAIKALPGGEASRARSHARPPPPSSPDRSLIFPPLPPTQTVTAPNRTHA